MKKKILIIGAMLAVVSVLLAICMSIRFNYGNQKLPSNEVDFTGMVINDNVVQGSMNKENLVSKYTTLKEQTVYTVGTLHNGHFNREQDYSLKDLESLLVNLNPDYIFIEAREESLEEYDVIDGPIEMIYAYSYGLEHDIPVRLIDYWKIDNNIVTNSSDDFRDNQIFYNMNEKLKEIEEDKTIVVLYGASHYFFQKSRIELAGWREGKIDNIWDLFQSNTDEFTYPKNMEVEIDKKLDYDQNIIPEIARENITDQKVLDDFLQNDMKKTLENYKKIVRENRLYDTVIVTAQKLVGPWHLAEGENDDTVINETFPGAMEFGNSMEITSDGNISWYIGADGGSGSYLLNENILSADMINDIDGTAMTMEFTVKEKDGQLLLTMEYKSLTLCWSWGETETETGKGE